MDEAHSSQSAGTSHKLKQLLGSAGAAGGDEAEEFSAEDVVTASQQARLLPPNMSVFAFTATPKAKDNRALRAAWAGRDSGGLPRLQHEAGD